LHGIEKKMTFHKRTRRSGTVQAPGGPKPKSEVHYIGLGRSLDASGGRLKIVDTVTGKIMKDLGDIPGAGLRPEKCGPGADTKQKQPKKRKE
jgi:hypothetical protein